MTIDIGNECLTVQLDGEGRCRTFADARTGRNFATGAPLAWIEQTDGRHPVSAAERAGDLVRLVFGRTGATATLRFQQRDRYLVAEVVAADGALVRSLDFVDIPLALAGDGREPFAACALALDLQTRVVELPGPGCRLRISTCFSRHSSSRSGASSAWSAKTRPRRASRCSASC